MSTEPGGPGSPHRTPPTPAPPSFEEQLRLALELSSQEQEERERLGQQEEEDLQRILQLSLSRFHHEAPRAQEEELPLRTLTSVQRIY